MAGIQRETYSASISIKTVGKRSYELSANSEKRQVDFLSTIPVRNFTVCLLALLSSLVLWQLAQKPAINCSL